VRFDDDKQIAQVLVHFALWFTIVALIFIVLYQQHGPHRKMSSGLLLPAFIPTSLITFDKMPVRSRALPL